MLKVSLQYRFRERLLPLTHKEVTQSHMLDEGYTREESNMFLLYSHKKRGYLLHRGYTRARQKLEQNLPERKEEAPFA
ncbi:hypothetical protein RRG08_023387 [Elysia crispata]|uniref:Uncharacterized protein n=1 Tax=Elysia crispata TaxID=231223 RepID=A0AAE1BCM6_9GAST|nr:hypothetical protein RRG08_023387 [Elysia crispata]